MPRDLAALRDDTNNDDRDHEDASLPRLTKSPEAVTPSDPPPGPLTSSLQSPVLDGADPGDDDGGGGDRSHFFAALAQRDTKRDELHPYTQTLSPGDVDSCLAVEESAFPPHERGTREKFEYRLRTCGELSMGIFTSAEPRSSSATALPTAATAAPVYSGAPARKAVLLGHIIGTRGRHETLTDADMEIPPSSSSSSSSSASAPVGHQVTGGTICIHSLAVLPAYRGRGLGLTLLKAYLQRMQTQAVAERAALIAHDALVPLYERVGFVSRGPSQVAFGGGGWVDMVLDLTSARLGSGGFGGDGEEEEEEDEEDEVEVEEVEKVVEE